MRLSSDPPDAPTLAEIEALQKQLGSRLVRTPVVRCRNLEVLLGNDIEVFGKLEFLQRTGTFKARGALVNMLSLNNAELADGVTTVSAGNHAIALSWAAREVGTHAKVVMLSTASPLRMRACREYGAEIVPVDDIQSAFDKADQIQSDEGMRMIHPFEGRNVSLGTGTLGLEICEQVDDFDAIVVPIGGGGLCGGVANAVRKKRPDTTIIGVEPEGADSMSRSFASGRPERLNEVDTIADSLGAPYAMPYSFKLCKDNVNEIVRVPDEALSDAMQVLFFNMKIAVEPACAASTAALLGPLRDRLRGRRVVLLFCGSNIDWQTFARYAKLPAC
jgi:threonine dehydratase